MTGRNRDTKDTDYGHSNRNRDTRDTDYSHSNRLTRYFDDFLNDVGLTRTHSGIRRMGPGEDKHASWTPAIDITENDGEYVIIADIPGVRKEDLDIELRQTMLVISGQNHQDPHVIAKLSQEIGVGKDNQYQQQPQQYQNQQQPQQYHPAQPQIVNEQQPQNNQTQQYPQNNQTQQYPQYQNQQPQPNQPTQTTQPSQPTQTTQPTQSNQPTQTTQPSQPTQPTQEYQNIKHHRQRDRENKENNSKIHVQERPYGYFSRTIQLPNDIKMEDNFQATLESGVLKIRVPKSNDKPRRKITVT